MTILAEERLSDSPYVETITRGRMTSAGSTIRPAEMHWHMVLVRPQGRVLAVVTGPLTTSGITSWPEGAEVLWIKFRLGTYMPHLPTRSLIDSETILPAATSQSFWLDGSVWQFPDFENVDTFVNRLARADVLTQDAVVAAAMQEPPYTLPARTVRHRFLHTTGLSQNTIRQMQRAQQAEALLKQGVSILDTVEEAGYFDQPHLTRSLRQFIGYTPAQIIRSSRPQACHSVQDGAPMLDYDTGVLASTR